MISYSEIGNKLQLSTPTVQKYIEIFIISEIKKEISYLDLDYKVNYWRLKTRSEVDLVLRNNQEFIGCEIKLTSGVASKTFFNRYPEAKMHVVTSDNFI